MFKMNEQRTKDMKKQARELIEQVYQRGFNVGYEEGKGQAWSEEIKKYEIGPDKKKEYIEQGRNEAWEAVKKFYLPVVDGGLPGEAIKELFGAHNWIGIVQNFSASEVVEKLKTWEQKQQEDEIHVDVGDEVTTDDGRKMIVLGRDCGGWYHLLNYTGLTYDRICSSDIKKTGRHFPEIAELLKKLKECEK